MLVGGSKILATKITPSKIIAHVIGLDEIHKKKLIKQLPPSVHAIDLDKIQQMVYNHKNIVKQKLVWGQLTRDIVVFQKQKRLIGSKQTKTTNLDSQIKKAMTNRNMVKKKIHQMWKLMMIDRINAELNDYKGYRILFLGFNIFPKDYRIKIDLSVPAIPTTKLIYSVKPAKYAANQIKFYLKSYTDKIVKGTFPLNLLKPDFVAGKYDKFTTYYDKKGYALTSPSEILKMINHQDQQFDNLSKLFSVTRSSK